uniref:Uncharacterized protein n=1 Tax=Aegilops tauschii subsp. strangulata TaxID=200361 RepID=A0A452YL01_AEGTS
ASDHVTGTSPMSLSSPSAFHTASVVSTMLVLQPWLESHSSTTLACTVRPFFLLVMLIILPHRRPPAYHLVDSATIMSLSLWYLPSHSDGAPPSSPFWNPFTVITPWCRATDNVDSCSKITSMATTASLVFAMAKLLPAYLLPFDLTCCGW